jgi:hypothetical protein
MEIKMNEKQPLLQKEGASECISTRMKIMIYILINCCAIHITGLAQPQYIFHYLKSLEESNDTDIKHSIYNKTNSHQNCSANSSTSDNTIQGSASVWTWYISLSEYGLALPVIFLSDLWLTELAGSLCCYGIQQLCSFHLF